MNTIFVGDTMPLVVLWFLPSDTNQHQFEDAMVSRATVKLIRHAGRSLIIDNEDADVDGNKTSYTIPRTITQEAGIYSAYVTAEFNDGNVVTQKLEFEVRPKT